MVVANEHWDGQAKVNSLSRIDMPEKLIQWACYGHRQKRDSENGHSSIIYGDFHLFASLFFSGLIQKYLCAMRQATLPSGDQ
jgi:hypothetical protein